MRYALRAPIFILSLFVASSLLPLTASAHCDTLDGPVVTAAKQALAQNNVNLVLPWVRPQDEAEIKRVFEQARTAQTGNESARAASSQLFFETLVRVHRAGEGAPYTGLKSSATEEEPAIALADAALAQGSIDSLARALGQHAEQRAHTLFSRVQNTKHYDPSDVEAGRAYVHNYVAYVHGIEALHVVTEEGDAHHGDAHTAVHASDAESENIHELLIISTIINGVLAATIGVIAFLIARRYCPLHK